MLLIYQSSLLFLRFEYFIRFYLKMHSIPVEITSNLSDAKRLIESKVNLYKWSNFVNINQLK